MQTSGWEEQNLRGMIAFGHCMSLPIFAGVLEDILSSLYRDGVWKVGKR